MAKEKKKPLTREDVLRLIKENGGKAQGLDLSGKVFEDGIDLRKLARSGISLSGIILKKADLRNAHLELDDLEGAHLEGADLRGAHLEKAHLWGAYLGKAHLEGANLEGAYLVYADLEAADLERANLEGAYLVDAHLEGTDLERANLEGADLRDTHLEKAHLWGAYLGKAHLWRAHLEGADLRNAHLEGADLRNAHLEAADLRDAHLEAAHLGDTEFFSDTRLENVDWGNYILGEEGEQSFLQAADTYRRLKMWYAKAGMYDIAGKFFFREMTAKGKALKWWPNPMPRAWSRLLSVICGYGEKPWRVVMWGISVVFGLALLYFFLRGVAPHTLTVQAFLDSLYYSAISFTALGYSPWFSTSSVRGWAQGVGAAEAIIGVFLIALFLATFVRKMTR